MPNNSQTLYLSKPFLELGGVAAPDDLMKDNLEFIVDESLHMPSMFLIKVHNVYLAASENSEPWKNEKYFKIGDRITIGFESSTTEDAEFRTSEKERKLIEGEITGIEVKFTNTSEAHLLIRGYDASHRLHRGRFNRSFLNCTDSDIVQRIASEARIQIGQLDDSGSVHEYVFQENQTNMEFLRERAARIGFELFVQNDKLYFREPKSEASLDLEWLTDISSFDVRVTSAEQVSSVEVNSWDYKRKELISETVSKEHLITETGNGDGSDISQEFKMKEAPKMIVVDQPVNSTKEAKQMAQALCNELSGEFVTADAKAEGNPEIRPGKVVALKDMGDRYSGEYYVTETCHRYSERVYKTDFTVRGLREGSLLSTLQPKTHLQPGQTLLVGLVTNNKDPEGLGRVKVKFPTLTMKDESYWARVVGLGASNQRGFYCLPEINDEVLVGFEHGDIHRPYIVGGVWNGIDKTVEKVDKTIKDGKVRLRTIKTRTGHTIQFVEEDDMWSTAGIYIKTSGGHRIDINDSEDYIRIKTSGGHSIKMDDNLLEQKIKIKSSGWQSIALDDLTRTIEIQTMLGRVQVEAIMIGLEALIIQLEALKIDLEAPVITLKGAVNILGDLTVEGATNITGVLGVEGMTNLAGGVAIEGAGTIDGAPLV
jgi:phage protein D/phage baseplate assembly protein gpV